MYFNIDNPKDYSVALYIRLSKEDDKDGPSESVTNQKSMLKDFTDKQKLLVYDIYIDDGYSGTNFDRPEFKRMIEDIESKKINMIITKDLSRLGRDYIMTGHYMEIYFPEKRVRYISLLDGIDTGIESTANDITPFRAIMNDMYAKDISKKIKSVKRDKQRKGEFIGGKPMFGYKINPNEKNKIIIDEKAANIVKKMFSMALDGYSCRKIATIFNEEKIPTPATYAGLTLSKTGPYSGMWSSNRVSEMLRNETYIGNMVQGKSVKINYKSKKSIKQAPENWIVVKNTHEPLVDIETFYKVQKILDSRKNTRNRKYDFLLKGIIYCHECGYPMAVINRKNKQGKDVLYFVCRTYQQFTKAGVCTCHTIKEEKINKAVCDKIEKLLLRYIDIDKMTEISQEYVSKYDINRKIKDDIIINNKKINEIENKIDRLYLDKIDEIMSDEDFNRIYKIINDERNIIQNKIKKLKKREKDISNIEDISNKIVQEFIDTICLNREILVSLIDKIEITENKEIIIKFKFKNPEENI